MANSVNLDKLNAAPLMTKKSPTPAVMCLLLTLQLIAAAGLFAQDCADPGLVCPLTSTDTLSSSDGIPIALPPGFCFDDAPNAFFFEFNTLDLVQFPDLTFNDPTAFLILEIDSCVTDTLFSDGLNFAVFQATNLCDPDTYDAPVGCVTGATQSGQLVLENLEPSTTYYVLVTSLTENFDDAIASDCAFRLSVAGPAVEYNLGAVPPTPQNQTIFPGQGAPLNVNPTFVPYEWSGEGLSGNTTSAAVTASPSDFGVFSYTAQTEINECPFQLSFLVTVVPPVTPFNAFTPNNDGFNDTWVIDRIQAFQNAQVIVYSRWGAKVFQATNYKNDWDGDGLPAATYYFVIELNDPDNFDAPPVTGSVTIVR